MGSDKCPGGGLGNDRTDFFTRLSAASDTPIPTVVEIGEFTGRHGIRGGGARATPPRGV